MTDIQLLKQLIKTGEKINVEFKKSKDSLARSVYESICAFLNRKGGHIFLGIANDRTIEGINHDTLGTQMKVLTQDLNNPQLINPPFTIVPKPLIIDGKDIIYIYVPESSMVHSYKGQFYDRNHEGDFVMRTQHQIANLFLRKERESYTENRVFPDITLDDFDNATFDEVRATANGHTKGGVHTWSSMSNKQILESAGMLRIDPDTGRMGYTLASVLVFGKESTIFRLAPQYKTDALCRINNTELYDDRDIVGCNLVNAYHRIMVFLQKYLPEMPYIEGTQRISLRDVIFREVVQNLLVHREFSNAFPATIVIYKDRVETHNWNLPHMMGRISLENLSPQPKNRVIANVFQQMGWMEELGSGTRKMFKYCPIMVPGSHPTIIEEDIFTTVIPIALPTINVVDSLSDKLSDNLSDKQKQVLALIAENGHYKAAQMAQKLSVSRNTINTATAKLTKLGLIERIGGDYGGYWKICNKLGK